MADQSYVSIIVDSDTNCDHEIENGLTIITSEENLMNTMVIALF